MNLLFLNHKTNKQLPLPQSEKYHFNYYITFLLTALFHKAPSHEEDADFLTAPDAYQQSESLADTKMQPD